jgi:hypothetical protein
VIRRDNNPSPYESQPILSSNIALESARRQLGRD